MLSIKLIAENGDVKFKAYGEEIDVHYSGEYEPGDKWRVELEYCEFVKLKLDETLAESIVFVPDGVFEFPIPFDYHRNACYGKDAFSGDDHRVIAIEPTESEIYAERLISLNSHDMHNVPKYFPHAVANFVTREDPCFFERNAIDGVTDNEGHGPYPYHSWGGGLREDLEFEIHFGTEVEVDRAVVHLRADFPTIPIGKRPILNSQTDQEFILTLREFRQARNFSLKRELLSL